MRLALSLGMTLDELLQRMSNWELTLWAAYYQLEPWGQQRDDVSRAVVGSAICRSLVGRDGAKASDLIPDWQAKPIDKRADWEAFIAAHNAQVERKG